MAFTIPTTKQLAAQFLAAIEVRINQTTPPVVRAFNRVLSAALAMFGTGIYKYVGDRALQALALTATGEGLDTIGANYGVDRRVAVAAVMELGLVATTGTIIPAATTFSSTSTGETYTTLVAVTAAADYAVLQAVASTPGDAGNLSLGEALAIGTPIVGANATAYVVADTTVDGVITAGEDREVDSAYRRRVLTRIRAAGGGGNSADYRAWAEEVADVARAFPYSGKPITFTATELFDITDGGGGGPFEIIYDGADPAFDFTLLGFHVDGVVTVSDSTQPLDNGSWGIIAVSADTLEVVGPLTANATEIITLVNESLPGDRTVYVESVSSPATCPADTLDDVRDHLLTDPDTGEDRMPLGLVDDRLYVESIYRHEIRVFVIGLDVAADIEVETKAKISASVADYVERVCCFVGGLDYPGDRVDTVSELTLSTVVQGILRGVGGSAEMCKFTIETVDYEAYQMSQGELLTLHAGDPAFSDVWPAP